MSIPKKATRHHRAKVTRSKVVIGRAYELRTRHKSYSKRNQQPRLKSTGMHRYDTRKRPNPAPSSSIWKRKKRALPVTEPSRATKFAPPSTESPQGLVVVERKMVADEGDTTAEAVLEPVCAPVKTVSAMTGATANETRTSDKRLSLSVPNIVEAESDGNSPVREHRAAENAVEEGEMLTEAAHSMTEDLREATEREAANIATGFAWEQHGALQDNQTSDWPLSEGENRSQREAARSAADPGLFNEDTKLLGFHTSCVRHHETGNGHCTKGRSAQDERPLSTLRTRSITGLPGSFAEQYRNQRPK
ncbi:hypothetical protein K491DRAFT_685504 [Lophiostoma macrostomum CBS 122681]|uniref:Uncharacterized protein n=1 Tax=Lophiostoma macrostomum CBS 122681 TaxID=1314788 RepID=A0A6A6SJ79_9PLEO|nr:hypothetical protein K491DRAFT_685504 [Lophiostoma macrostomum CBS 122681]